jgi:acetyl-CoA C-acetyltransferase
MTIKRQACIAGAFEHPTRKAPDKTVAQLHAECARGALADAGLTLQDVDGYFCAGDAPGLGPNSMADYLGLKPAPRRRHRHRRLGLPAPRGARGAGHRDGRCNVALITLAGRPRSEGSSGVAPRIVTPTTPDVPFEMPYARSPSTCTHWRRRATCTNSAPRPSSWRGSRWRRRTTRSTTRTRCCASGDGGRRAGLADDRRPAAQARLLRRQRRRRRAGRHPAGDRAASRSARWSTCWAPARRSRATLNGQVDLTWSAAALSGPAAFAEAGVTPQDIQYASIYDSFTITVLMQLEDLGFCKKGEGGRFVADGNLISGVGRLPFNTDGGGLCNNHPANRGGITKVIEAVRQLRGEAHPAVQVPNCQLALAQGMGGLLGSRHGCGTLILERA